jgi:hypothetical protein
MNCKLAGELKFFVLWTLSSTVGQLSLIPGSTPKNKWNQMEGNFRVTHKKVVDNSNIFSNDLLLKSKFPNLHFWNINRTVLVHVLVTIAGEGLQNLDLIAKHSGLLSREGSFSCHTCCDMGHPFFRSHLIDCPIKSPSSYDARMVWRIYSNPDHHKSTTIERYLIIKDKWFADVAHWFESPCGTWVPVHWMRPCKHRSRVAASVALKRTLTAKNHKY